LRPATSQQPLLNAYARRLLEPDCSRGAHHALYHTGAYTELPADLEDPVPAVPQFLYSRFNSRLDATPPEFRSFLPLAWRMCSADRLTCHSARFVAARA
jgi:hypothetical protein